MKQQSFLSLEQTHKKKRTQREVVLAEMDRVVPWSRMEALIAPHYTKPRRGRPQMPLAVMLRIYLLQQWYGLNDPGAEEALYDMHSMRVDATLIAASPSTKNKAGKRDAEMSQTKKGNQWYIGAKTHVDVDAHSGLVHTMRTTSFGS